jgi:hypothetical protein
MLNSSRMLGGSIGLAVLSTVAATVTDGGSAPAALSDGYSTALLVGGALIAVGALSALTVPAKKTTRSTVEAR